MKIFYVNNSGGGYANTVEVEDGMTIKNFFTRQLPDADPARYAVRVNRNPVDPDHVLRDGDRVTITPAKIAGAATTAEKFGY